MFLFVLTLRGHLPMETKTIWGTAVTNSSTFFHCFSILIKEKCWDGVLHIKLVVCGLEIGQKYRNVQLSSYTKYIANLFCIFTFKSQSLIRILKYCKMLGKNVIIFICYALLHEENYVLLCLLNATLWRLILWKVAFTFDTTTKWLLRITNLPIYTQRKGQKLLAKVVRAYRVEKLTL